MFRRALTYILTILLFIESSLVFAQDYSAENILKYKKRYEEAFQKNKTKPDAIYDAYVKIQEDMRAEFKQRGRWSKNLISLFPLVLKMKNFKNFTVLLRTFS